MKYGALLNLVESGFYDCAIYTLINNNTKKLDLEVF